MAVRLAKLAGYDLEILIDRSGSMSKEDVPVGKKGLFGGTKYTSRWASCAEQTAELAGEACKVDDDGIYVGLFNTRLQPIDNADADKVRAAFKQYSPTDGTNTADALNARINAYFERKAKGGAKPLILICVTDGEPTGSTVSGVSRDAQQAVADVISNATKKISSRKEIGIFFIQVGFDKAATVFLQWLDDGLVAAGAAHDIVDAKTAEDAKNMSITDIIEAALND
jgi:hypothetical protein